MATSFDRQQTARGLLLNQFRLYSVPRQTSNIVATEKANSRLINFVIRKILEILFPDEAVETSAGKVVADAGTNAANAAGSGTKDSTGEGGDGPRHSGRIRNAPRLVDLTGEQTTPLSSTKKRKKPSSSGGGEKKLRRVIPKPPRKPGHLKFKDETVNEPPIGYEAQFQEANARPEPVISKNYLDSSSTHEVFRDQKPTPKLVGTVARAGPSSSTAPTNQFITIPREDPTPLLRAAHIPKVHFANIFFNHAEVTAIKNLAWYWGTYDAFRQLDVIPSSRQQEADPFEQVNAKFNSGIAMSLLKASEIEVKERGYTILEDLADPCNVELHGDNIEAFDIPASLQLRSLRKYFDDAHGTVDVDEALKNDNCAIWRTLFNTADVQEDAKGVQRRSVRFSSTWDFNMRHLLQPGPTNWMNRYRCLFELYIAFLCNLVGLYKYNDRKMCFPKTSGRSILTWNGCPSKIGHKYFYHREPGGPGFFVIITGQEGSRLWVAEGSRKYVHESDRCMSKMGKLLKMEEIVIPPNSVFI